MPSGARSPPAAIVRSSDDAIIGKTLEGIVTAWNPAAERIFGYGAAEMIGQSIMRIIPEDRVSEEEHILERIRRGETVDHLETVRVTKGGRRVNISLTSSPIRDIQGRVIGASKIARDITERTRAAAAAHRSEAHTEAIFEAASDAILIVDQRGDDHLGPIGKAKRRSAILGRPCWDSRWRCCCPSACGAGISAIAPRTSRIPTRDRWVVASTSWRGEAMARSFRWRSP
jgi:PAS domain S-box-containing protein